MMLKKVYLLSTITNFIILFAYIITLPNSVPVQIGLDMRVLMFGSKWSVPFVMAIAPLAGAVLLFFESKSYKPQKTFHKILRYFFIFMICFLTYMSWVVVYVAGSGVSIGSKVSFPLALTFALILGICLISIAPRVKICQFGGKFGLKTKWTNYSKSVWDKTHLVSSYLILSAGIICALSGIIDHLAKTNSIVFLIGLCLTIFIVCLPNFFAYLFYKNELKKEKVETQV